MHYYGHGSWIAIVIFVGLLVVRVLSSQRRRGERRGSALSGSSFTASRRGPPATRVPSAARVPPAAPSAGVGVAPGWFRDPTGRHEQRYWSGTDWTDHVDDAGIPGSDPPPPTPPPRAR